MLRNFNTHHIRKQTELSGKLWDFRIKEDEKTQKVWVPSCWETYPGYKTAKMPVTPKTIPIIGKNVRAALIIWHTMVTRTTDATMVIETDFLRNPNHRETTPSSPARIEQESRKLRDCRNTLIVSLSEQSGNSDSVRKNTA